MVVLSRGRGVKLVGHEVDCLPPFSAEAKNERSYTSTPPDVPSWYGQGQLHYRSNVL
jgi:hypothetical protein